MMDQHKADAEDKGRRKRKINSTHNFMQVCSTVTSFVILTSAIRSPIFFSSFLTGSYVSTEEGQTLEMDGV